MSDRLKTRLPVFAVVLLAGIYLAGLTRDLTEPWIGLHDWNGAFYSQLARNLLRYPFSVHHGMPLVAMGQQIPAPDERSIYPTHPAGLMWLVAGAFLAFRESEWAARVVPIAASLGSLLLFVRLVGRSWGRETAIIAGLVYAVLPMAVYFGRMVDHEAVCLFFMLLAISAWDDVSTGQASWRRRIAMAIWIGAVAGGVWTDWAGLLFAGVFAAHATYTWRRGRVSAGCVAMCWATVVIASSGMILHVVYAGFGGRWGDVAAVFSSRTGRSPSDLPPTAWTYALEDFTWPVMALAGLGIAITLWDTWQRPAMGSSDRVTQSTLTRSASSRQRLSFPPRADPPEAESRGGNGATPLDARAAGRAGGGLLGGGMWVLAVTGVLWVGIFWRQFRIHNYWLFYLGPVAALLSARGVVFLHDAIGKARTGPRWIVLLAMLGLVVVRGWRGTNIFFQSTSITAEDIAAWKRIHAMTRAGDRVLMFPDPTLIDEWGGTRFRNIGSPQMAYYMDRAFEVEGYLDRVGNQPAAYPVYVVNLEAIGESASMLTMLGERFPFVQAGNFVVFDLKKDRGAARTGTTSARSP